MFKSNFNSLSVRILDANVHRGTALYCINTVVFTISSQSGWLRTSAPVWRPQSGAGGDQRNWHATQAARWRRHWTSAIPGVIRLPLLAFGHMPHEAEVVDSPGRDADRVPTVRGRNQGTSCTALLRAATACCAGSAAPRRFQGFCNVDQETFAVAVRADMRGRPSSWPDGVAPCGNHVTVRCPGCWARAPGLPLAARSLPPRQREGYARRSASRPARRRASQAAQQAPRPAARGTSRPGRRRARPRPSRPGPKGRRPSWRLRTDQAEAWAMRP